MVYEKQNLINQKESTSRCEKGDEAWGGSGVHTPHRKPADRPAGPSLTPGALARRAASRHVVTRRSWSRGAGAGAHYDRRVNGPRPPPRRLRRRTTRWRRRWRRTIGRRTGVACGGPGTRRRRGGARRRPSSSGGRRGRGGAAAARCSC